MKLSVGLFLLVFSSMSFAQDLAKVVIEDADVSYVLDKYDKRLKEQGEKGDLQILMRIDTVKGNRVLYIGSARFFSQFFYDNIPDQYADFNDRKIFIFNREKMRSFSKESKQSFGNQFHTALVMDITLDGEDVDSVLQMAEIRHFEVWRVVLKKESIDVVKRIADFPFPAFLERYNYDGSGNMVYKDGIFHAKALDPGSLVPEVIVKDYVRDKMGESLPNRTKSSDVEVYILVDQIGNVTKVEIQGINDVGIASKLRRILLRMPKWEPGRVNGKTVVVREKISW